MREPNSKLTCDTHFAVGEGNWFSNFVMTCDMFCYENEIIKIKFFMIFFILNYYNLKIKRLEKIFHQVCCFHK